MRRLALVLLLAACAKPPDNPAGPLIEKTRAGRPERERRLACIQLGRLGGDAARDRLLELLLENTRTPQENGPVRLYAAVGLTLLKDPGTAIDLLLALSTVNPDDNIAALASEERSEEYYSIDAQICDALLSMGLLCAEEELVEQLRRRHRIRVMIDAYAVLRRHTGKQLPFRYNGSYDDREADADAWLAWLRKTRAQRRKKRPLDAANPRFVERCQALVDDLGKESVNDQLIAQKVLLRVGVYAVPFLLRALGSQNRTSQRQAALALGRIGSPDALPGLRAALELEDADARGKAIDALRLLGDRRAGPAVTAKLADQDVGVRTAAMNFLGALGGGQEHERLLRIFAEDERPHDRAIALRALMAAYGQAAPVSAQASRAERDRAAAKIRAWWAR